MVGLPHRTRRKKEGTNPGRKHLEEMGERRRAFARKKRRGKRAERKSVRKKHKAARARSRLGELTFGTFNVRTAVVSGVNGIGHIDTLLRTCAAKGCNVIGLQETKRNETSEISASGCRIVLVVIAAWLRLHYTWYTIVLRSRFLLFVLQNIAGYKNAVECLLQ